MGMRELLILLLILAIVGVILRVIYVALRSRRNELRVALEKNVPAYDLEEIELRELPNGGARVVERSFAHVQAQNQRFSPRKTKGAPSLRGSSVNKSPGSTAPGSSAGVSGVAKSASMKSSSGKSASKTIPVLMNSVPANARGLSASSAAPEKSVPPPMIDDLISSLEDELDEQLDAHQGDERPQETGDYMEPTRIEVEMLEADEQAEIEKAERRDQSAASNTASAEPPILTDPILAEPVLSEPVLSEPVPTEPVLTEPVLDERTWSEPLESDAVQQDEQEEESVLRDPVMVDVDVENLLAEDGEPVDDQPVHEPVFDGMTARANPEADGHYEDDTETNYDSYEADQDIEQKSYSDINDVDEMPEEVFISTEREDDGILGDFDNDELDFEADDAQQRRGKVDERESGSAIGRLMGWMGAKLGGRSKGQAGAGSSGRRTAAASRSQDDDDILFDAPMKSADDMDDLDVGVGPVRESRRGQKAARARQPSLHVGDNAAAGQRRPPARGNPDQARGQAGAQKRPAMPTPQQQSLLNMENEGAPTADDPALHEDPYDYPAQDELLDAHYEKAPVAPREPVRSFDRSVPKSQSQAEKAQAARARTQARDDAREQARADEEAEAARQNNNIAPDYSEVLIVNVMARGDSVFQGVDLLPALLSCGLRFGEMNIFHRHVDERGQGPVLFSVANIVNPGTFNLNGINDFETRGVCFFLTLPNVINNMQAFDRMIDTAQKLRSTLDGELKDDNRSVMTAQTIEHYRQRVRDFELRQLRQH